jgi:DNA-binding response OmpR family regulator
LTVREFDLLTHLMANPGQVLGRDELLASVWGWTVGDTATVTVHVGRLREKIEADPSSPQHLQTVRGVGYRWSA